MPEMQFERCEMPGIRKIKTRDMKVTLIHADWCPVCQATKKLWNEGREKWLNIIE